MGKLSVGAGLAQGAQAFMQSFLQAKQFKMQEKLQKNATIVEFLTRQLADENVPYNDRAKILDSIPNLVGAKLERPLSQMMGLDKFNEQEVEDPNSPKTPAIPAQQAKPAEEGGSPLFAREEVPEGAGGHTGSTQQGNLTPAIIKKKLQLELKKAEDTGDIDKATKIFAANLQMQKDLGTKGGYTIALPSTFDEDGNYIFNRMNVEGDRISINMGKVTPEAIRKAEIMIDKPSSFIKERVDFHMSQGKSEEEAERLALADSNEKFQLKKKTGEAYATSINQGITGTKPIQPAQVEDDERADKQLRLAIQKDIDESTAEMVASKNVMNSLEASKKAAGDAVTAANNALNSTELTPGEPGYANLVTQAERARDNFTQIEKQYNEAFQKESLAKQKLSGAQRRLSSAGSGSEITPQVKSAIDIVRKNNPDKTANMSDLDILQILRAKGKVK